MKLTEEELNKFKAKVITKVGMKVFIDGREDMEKIQSEVAQELSQSTGHSQEKCDETVRLIVAEFIDSRMNNKEVS